MSGIAVVVFTVEGFDTIQRQGGTQHWILNRSRASESDFVVLVQNRIKSDIEHHKWKDFATATHEHGTAFMVGRIADIVRSHEVGRWLIKISEYAEIDVPHVWKGWRFPLRYMPLSDFAIDPKRLTFQPLLGANGSGPKATGPTAPTTNGAEPLSIAEAKRRLAATLGVSEKDIEITVHA